MLAPLHFRSRSFPFGLTIDDRFMGPAWAVTYPPGTREVMLGRHRHVTASHALNQRCKEAAAAMCQCAPPHTKCGLIHSDIKLLRQWHHTRAPIQGVANSDDMLPYLELHVDAEAIAHEATCLARSPKEHVSQNHVEMPELINSPSLTVEAHLWALEDLHVRHPRRLDLMIDERGCALRRIESLRDYGPGGTAAVSYIWTST